MKPRTLATALFLFTGATVALFPAAQATFEAPSTSKLPVLSDPVRRQAARVEVVFVLDTTGSMAGLINAAKEKIWSIASSMASANQAPEIRMGLVAYRDRGDAYVTRVVDLSADLDTVYAKLMEFQADGGGDTPESVNQALNEAVHRISWSQDPGTYRAVFLVGDAPPQMHYPDDVPYPRTLADARARGIVINAIHCGDMQATRQPWEHIAALGEGRYFHISANGNAVAIATPYDERLATLSRELDESRMYYGDEARQAAAREKKEATDKVHDEASVASRARRATFNVSASGEANRIGESELVDDVASGRVALEAIPAEHLPASVAAAPAPERRSIIEKLAVKRDALMKELKDLAGQRADYLKEKTSALGGAEESLDQKVYDAVREQAAKAGLRYESDAPSY